MRLLPSAYLVMALPFIIGFFALIALFVIDLTFDVNEPGATYGNLRGFARLVVDLGYKRRLTEAGLDLALITAAYFGAFLIRFDFAIDNEKVAEILPNVPYVLAVSYPAFFACAVYRGFWRYAGLSEVARLANAAICSAILVTTLSWFRPIMLSRSIAVLFCLLLFNLLVASRLSFRAFRKGIILLARARRRVLIVGASARAEAAARYVTSDSGRDMRLVGFIDGDAFKAGKLIHGSEVLGTPDDLEALWQATAFNEILLASDAIGRDQLEYVSAFARDHSIPVMNFSIELNEIAIGSRQSSSSESEKTILGELASVKSSVA